MKSTQIQNDLNQVNQRLAELIEMRGKLENNVEKLQSSFIDKKLTLDDVQKEQSKLDTLNNSIRTLETTRNNLQGELDQAVASETRETLLSQAKSSAIEAETAINNYLEARHEFNELTAEFSAKMLDAIELFRSKQRAYRQFIEQVETKYPGQIDLGLKAETLAAATAQNIPYPNVEFAEIVDGAVNLLANRRAKSKSARRYHICKPN